MILKLAIVCVLCILGAIVLYFAAVLIYASLVTINRDPVSDALAHNGGEEFIDLSEDLEIMIWNIGYGGLGKEMDHFYEGGVMTRPEEILSESYLKGIGDFITQHETTGFILLQEVDFGSKRSYNRDQSGYFKKNLKNHSESIAINYKSGFIPFPLFNPMGKVSSGLVTYAGYNPSTASRIQSAATYSYPKKIFMMRRCILTTHFKVVNGKELVLIHIHNSAYDDADKMRSAELAMIRSEALKEFNKGNYVIIGGDWNQNPSGLDLSQLSKYKTHPFRPIESNYLPTDWDCIFDPKLPTNRDVNEPFDLHSTSTSVLDYFFVSPNIEAGDCKTIDLNFEYSDHNPVIMKFRLK